MMQSPQAREAIAAIGREMGPHVLQRVHALYREEQERHREAQPATAVDIAYGEDPRQNLDLYAPAGAKNAPILVWVFGGGFIRGEKSSPDHPFNAHVGRWAAREGFLGVVIDYRLAPDHVWPAGGEDVALVMDWIVQNAAQHGGDPERVVLVGTSAGAVHVSTYLQRHAGCERVCGAVLLSGLYGFTPLDQRDTLYYGDAALYPARMPRDAIVNTEVPLLVACSEFDPPRFQAEALGLLQQRLATHGAMPRAHFAVGHNHYSIAYHLGGDDSRLSDEIAAFVRECCGSATGSEEDPRRPS